MMANFEMKKIMLNSLWKYFTKYISDHNFSNNLKKQ